MRELPPSVAWNHVGARDGFEVLFLGAGPDGVHARGRTSAVQDGSAWAVRYEIGIAAGWLTRRAEIVIDDVTGSRRVSLTVTDGRWEVDGRRAPQVDGCLDVDLEASAFTNALPMHRLGLAVGEQASAPAAFVTAAGEVERLDQHYRRLPDADGSHRYDYTAPRFDFHAVLTYDQDGLVLDYPGLAVRAGV